MFLDLVDKVIMQINTVDVAKKLSTVMASDVHQISLFTPDFISKLINCVSPLMFKVYMLPYMSWFDYSILKQMANLSGNEEVVRIVEQFSDFLDYSKPVLSCDIPEFSQLVIPLGNCCYTILATKHIKSINKLSLKHLVDIKKLLIKKFEITEYAIQLAAIHIEFCCFYWLIPIQIQLLIEDALNNAQLELWDNGIVLTALLPVNSDGDIVQHSILDIFAFSYVDSEDVMEVSAMCCTYNNYLHIRM